MLTRVDLSENVSTWRGGALYIQEGDLRVTDTSIERNSAATRGGGIYFAASDPGDVVELRNTRVQDNTSDLEGGGVYCNGGWMRFFDSVIANNTTTGDGGGIFSRLCRPVALQNTTVSGNTAGGLGGGIFNSREMELVHSTVAANASGQNDVASALFLAGGTKLRLHNSLVVGTCVRCAVPDPDTITLCGSPPETTVTGINVELDGTSCLPRSPEEQRPDLISVTPEELKLGPLADNGGPTSTHALLAGSVAIDAIPEDDCVDAEGEPLTRDQRGVERPQGPQPLCDVGSFELESLGL